MEPVVFFKVAWLEHYAGAADENCPLRAGHPIKSREWRSGALNFLALNEQYYGDALCNRSAIDLARLGAPVDAEYMDGVTVIWVADSPDGVTRIIGWYKNARVFRHRQPLPEGLVPKTARRQAAYFVTAAVPDCTPLPEKNRTFQMRIGKFGFRNTHVWWADRPSDIGIRQEVLDYISGVSADGSTNACRYWLFAFHISGTQIREGSELDFDVGSYWNQIVPNDQVYFYRPGAQPGIVGRGTVLTYARSLKRRLSVRIDLLFEDAIPRSVLSREYGLYASTLFRSRLALSAPIPSPPAAVLENAVRDHVATRHIITAGRGFGLQGLGVRRHDVQTDS